MVWRVVTKFNVALARSRTHAEVASVTLCDWAGLRARMLLRGAGKETRNLGP